jgi:hypothetical protein
MPSELKLYQMNFFENASLKGFDASIKKMEHGSKSMANHALTVYQYLGHRRCKVKI